MSTPDDDARHKSKMANRKAIQDAEVAGKTAEKGLLVVHTGKGKGKSTAAWGLLLRALGRGFQCGVVQFGKGAWQTGERAALAGVVADEEVGAVLLGAGGDQRVAQVRRVVEVLGGGVGERGRAGEVVELFGGVDAAAVED